MNKERHCWGLLRRRQCLVPTWRGGLLLFLLAVGLFWVGLNGIHPFLAVNAPVEGGDMVVEGWMADYALKEALQEFQKGGRSRLYVTGSPLDAGAPLSEYRSYAELGAAVLAKFGAETNALQAVPAPRVKQDRTYASAIALKRWLEVNGIQCRSLTVVSEGTHARRSRLLFEKAFGPEVQIGIIALTPESYDPKKWWRSSQGVRVVIGEALAYGYARFVFSPKKGILQAGADW